MASSRCATSSARPPRSPPEILKQFKVHGFEIVQIVGKTPLEPKKQCVEQLGTEIGHGLEDARPMSSEIKTISVSGN